MKAICCECGKPKEVTSQEIEYGFVCSECRGQMH